MFNGYGAYGGAGCDVGDGIGWWNSTEHETKANTITNLREEKADLQYLACYLRTILGCYTAYRQIGAEHERSPEYMGEELFESSCGGEAACIDKMDYSVMTFEILEENYCESEVGPLIRDLEAKIDDLKREVAQLYVEIEYEKEQRGNLTYLREEKGITDDHLDVIYGDREELVEEVIPESVIVDDLEEEAEVRKWGWIAAGVVAFLGMSAVGWEVYQRRA